MPQRETVKQQLVRIMQLQGEEGVKAWKWARSDIASDQIVHMCGVGVPMPNVRSCDTASLSDEQLDQVVQIVMLARAQYLAFESRSTERLTK